MCLGKVDSFTKEIDDTEAGNYPIWEYKSGQGTFIVWKDTDELIKDFKEHFKLSTQKEVYELLKEDSEKGDIKYYYDQAVENLKAFEQLEIDIRDFKDNAKKYLIEELQYEIDTFIEDEYSVEIAIEKAETGDYSKIDSIQKIEGDELITNRNAKVPLQKAKDLLKAIVNGCNVIGQKVGHYTVNCVDKRTNDTYVKIGCHLFSVKQVKTLI